VLTRCEWEEITDFNEKCPEIPALTLLLTGMIIYRTRFWNSHLELPRVTRECHVDTCCREICDRSLDRLKFCLTFDQETFNR